MTKPHKSLTSCRASNHIIVMEQQQQEQQAMAQQAQLAESYSKSAGNAAGAMKDLQGG